MVGGGGGAWCRRRRWRRRLRGRRRGREGRGGRRRGGRRRGGGRGGRPLRRGSHVVVVLVVVLGAVPAGAAVVVGAPLRAALGLGGDVGVGAAAGGEQEEERDDERAGASVPSPSGRHVGVVGTIRPGPEHPVVPQPRSNDRCQARHVALKPVSKLANAVAELAGGPRRGLELDRQRRVGEEVAHDGGVEPERVAERAGVAPVQRRLGPCHGVDERTGGGGPAVGVEGGHEGFGVVGSGAPQGQALGVDDRALGRRPGRVEVVGPGPAARADLGQAEATGGVAQAGPLGGGPPAVGDEGELPGPVPGPEGCVPGRLLTGVAVEQRTSEAVGAPVGLDVAGGRHPGQGGAGRALREAEQLAGADQGEGRQPGRVDAEEGRRDHRPGGERPSLDVTLVRHVHENCKMGPWP